MTQAAGSARQPRDLTWLVVVLFTIVWALFIHTRSYSHNDASRLATIESLVHRGTWAIDKSRFSFTVDQIKVGEHFYSTKPPMLSLIGAGVYYVLHNGLGFELQATGCAPERSPTHCRALLETEQADWAHFILTLLLVSSPATLILALTYRLARARGLANGPSLTLTLALGLGTSLFPFSTVFTNHVPAAAATLVAFYILLVNESPSRFHLAAAGLFAVLAATIDLSNGAFALGLGVYVILRYRRDALWFVLGGAGPALLAAILDYQIVGNPFPPQMYSQGYNYEGSAFAAAVAGNQSAQNIPLYAFQLFLGDHGVLFFYPIVLWYVYALGCALRSPHPTTRWMAWTAAACSIIYVLYFVLSTDNFGGLSYSPRWLLNPVPLLAIFAVSPALYRSRWRVGLAAGLAAFSVLSAYWGALDPWTPAWPLFHLEYTAPAPDPSLAICVSGYDSFYDIDPAIRKSFGANRAPIRWFDARGSFVVPDGPAWWFINESTPLSPLLAAPLGLSVEGNFSLQADLTQAARNWLKTFQKQAYQSADAIPSLDRAPETIPLSATFGEQVTLLGYQQQQSQSQITIITAWRIETRQTSGQRKIFAHLLAPDGSITQQDDIVAMDYAYLFPGDELLLLQTLPLDGVPPGKYWLQIGLYDPETGARLTIPQGADRLLLALVEKRDQ